ncbi:hypothetical protein NSPZN2_150054 [Nitrospira defluvii]|uniref:Uncharacterized protein n=1 Tax=Nitrospira defluvii TaxID=330214 RepID=A0ABM8RAP1_9BACT|nr:hypothetical protein NSPZN2_150054 [Nitrospira defluvii]
MVLLENPTHRPGPARDVFPLGLLVAQPASGVSSVAAASGICDGIERELQPIVLPVRQGESNAVHTL